MILIHSTPDGSIVGLLGVILILTLFFLKKHMGLSENSVPLYPMVNDHYPY